MLRFQHFSAGDVRRSCYEVTRVVPSATGILYHAYIFHYRSVVVLCEASDNVDNGDVIIKNDAIFIMKIRTASAYLDN